MERITRREFFRLSALSAAATVAAACAQTTTPVAEPAAAPAAPAAPPAQPTAAPAAPAQPAAPAAPVSKYSEAPMLAEKVAKGELPPVTERLPENPFVITGLDGIGNYGGSMRKSFSGQADYGTIDHMNMRGMLNINHEMVLHSYLVEAWEVTPDAKEYTIHLRKGLKWSDGQPMTAEDYRFWVEDVQKNKELTKTISTYFSSQVGDERVPVEFAAREELLKS